MSAPVSAPPVERPPAPGSFPSRFAGVFFSPRETFADIARNPDWITPLVVIILASVIVSEVILAKIDLAPLMRAAIEHSSRASQLSPEQMDQQVQIVARFTAALMHAGFLLGILLMVVTAAIGMGIMGGIWGVPVTFKKSLSITSYAYLTHALAWIMAIVMVLFGDREHFNLRNPIPTNPGFFMNPFEGSKPLLTLASMVDLFAFWFMALLGVGFSEASQRKVRAVPVFLSFLGVWAIVTLLLMGLSMLGG